MYKTLASKPETDDEDNVKPDSQVKTTDDNQAKSSTKALKTEKHINLNYMSGVLECFTLSLCQKTLNSISLGLPRFRRRKPNFGKKWVFMT